MSISARIFVVPLLACLLAVPASPAAAQMFLPGYGVNGAPMSSFLATGYLTQKLVNDKSFAQRASAAASPARAAAESAGPMAKPVSGPSRAARRLADAYPETHRAQAHQLFDQLLAAYPKVEAQLGIPPGDLGGAVAAFVTGAYAGANGEMPADETFMPLVRQMRAALAGTPAVVQASDAQRLEMYETLAIVGLLTSTTVQALKSAPDATKAAQARVNLRQASQGYLREFLGVDADRVRLGPQGLSLR